MTPETTREKIEKFLTDTADSRLLSEKCRDYFDHKQWTEAEVSQLAKRKQAPIVVNRIRPKIKGLLGLYNLRLSDPKAYPRTKKHEKAAHAATDAIRFVADNNKFKDLRITVAENAFVEGYGGAMVDVKQNKKGEIEIRVEEIPWDRIYYDPHSRKKDFSDCRYKGIILWLYRDEAKEMFPDAAKRIDEMMNAEEYQDETFEDRPSWVDKSTDRIRIAYHYEIVKGEWKTGFLCGNEWLIEPITSPFLDEDGDPTCNLELVSLNVDRENGRYGEAAGFLSQQDEINHRRSKGLHTLSNRQTFGRKGAKGDIASIKRELSKPDGHVEFNGDEWGKDFGVIPTGDMLRGQLELYQDAKAELDSVGFNAQLAGERQQGDLSGVAINKLQQAGTIELNQDYSLLSAWELRIYRQIWARVKQFWKEEKWVRITDDQDTLRWVGFNSPLTTQQYLEEIINDESKPITERQQASAAYQFFVQNNDPRLNEIVGVTNEISDLDVDLILDQSFDVINGDQEQLQLLAEFARGSDDIDFLDLVELSGIRNKDKLIEKIEQRRQAAAEAAGNIQQIQSQDAQATVFEKTAKADLAQSKATQTKIENELLIRQPIAVTSVAV